MRAYTPVPSDITVNRVQREECEYWCEKGRVTHFVEFAIRSVGEIIALARGCEECMTQYAEKMKRALGSASEEA